MCNDGIDNDGNLIIDSKDPSCDSALDEIEDENADDCANGSDDDGDGWIDLDDVDCRADGSETGFTFGCNDGYDNDFDGLIDAMISNVLPVGMIPKMALRRVVKTAPTMMEMVDRCGADCALYGVRWDTDIGI